MSIAHGTVRRIHSSDDEQRKEMENIMKIPFNVYLTICILSVLTTGASLQAATPEESLKASFPNIKAESVTPTAITGVYEIVVGGRVAYYAPGPEYLIIGQLVAKDGKNITQERIEALLVGKIKNVPLEKALKIGSGPHTVIEITDPDCAFCRQGSTYLSKRKDLSRYVFFFPLPIHPNAEAKIRYIFCAEDRAQAYEEAMAGKLDEMKFKPCDNPAAAELLKAHKEMGTRTGVTSTPLFFIDGQ
ncbi:MAG: DsbC family protein, partial [Syntrophales bacterium LBB04]|nr:DsbC family protein [Syntrophales bacterium LBB04]